jgi:hypothetical protein
MALVSLTARKVRYGTAKSGKLYDSVAFGVDDENIVLVVPSICKKDGVSDGLVNSKVTVFDGDDRMQLWCTQTVTEVVALS